MLILANHFALGPVARDDLLRFDQGYLTGTYLLVKLIFNVLSDDGLPSHSASQHEKQLTEIQPF